VERNLPVFETARLILRGVTEADAHAYERHFVDYAVIGNLAAFVPWPYPAGGVLEFIRTQVLPNQAIDRWVWGIFLKTDPGELVGVVELLRQGRPKNRGFWLSRELWGRGIMTEAVVPVMDYAFDSLGFEKLTFTNAVGNVRSRRVKEKTGARLVGVEPARYVNPNFTEREVWEITKEEWHGFRAGGKPGPVLS
jgi:RimJ/RimL family protein N-acetyltransferase